MANIRIICQICNVILSRARLGIVVQWLACQTLDPEDQGRFPSGHFYKMLLISPFNAKLLQSSNMELYKRQKLLSLTFYIELFSKYVGVGLHFAALKDN